MDLQENAQHVVEFVRNNGGWAVPVVFGLAFGESLAFISLLIPAWGALVAIGALIVLPPRQTAICVGRRYATPIGG